MRSESGNSDYSELKAKWEQMAKRSDESGPSKSSQQSPPSSEINGEYPVGEGKGANRTGSVIASRGPFRIVRRQNESKPIEDAAPLSSSHSDEGNCETASTATKADKQRPLIRKQARQFFHQERGKDTEDLSASIPKVISSSATSSTQNAEWTEKVSSTITKGESRIGKKRSKTFALLMKQVPDVNRREEKWMQGTALHQVAKERSPLGFVKVLADCGIDFNIQDEWGNTALLWAIANGNNEMAMEILKHDQDLNLQGLGNSALHVTIAKGYKKKTAHKESLSISNLKLVQTLAAAGADPNQKNKMGLTPLHLACIRRDPGMIKALLENGADLDIKGPDGKTCRELLDLSYDEAKALLDEVAIPNTFSQKDFEANYKKCLKLI